MLTSGFTNTPVSKALVFYTIASSILASITDTKYFFPIQVVPHLWVYRQVWRLFTWQACYTNSTEVLFAVMTFYHLRIIERLWGSRKFASFLLSTFPYTTLLPPLLLALFLRPLSFNNLNYLPAGPTPLLFALLAQYHAAIPQTYKYRIAASAPPSDPNQSSSIHNAGMQFTSKTLSYLPAAQLALSQLPGSLIAAAVGWAVGYAYRMEALPLGASAWRVPGWVVGEAKRPGSGREGFDTLRRRLEGEGAGSASGVQGQEGEGRRRTLGGLVGEMVGAGGSG